MKIRPCSDRPILEPCSVQGYAFQLDPYIGCEHHCYYCYALNQAETDWAEEILIHRDLAARLSGELSALEPQPMYIGWNSDAYQPSEASHRQTRQALELLAQRGFSVCILTKSDLVTRDMDLVASMRGSSVGFSIAFQDEGVRRLFEVAAPPNERRLETLRRLKEGGIETYVLITPVMPFISDVRALIDLVAPYADTIWIYGLSLKTQADRNWRYVRGILERHFPELTEQYRHITFSADHPYWTELRGELEALGRERGLDLRIGL